ncbi:putative bifunctional diguanylate cyclase/phosphodiesterase [Teichococcus cervicalis]|uniref:Cyclic diguanylate phosphodiesterase (EAL) domain protein n=1 Tax=Pseudoroseomonas cervicalis ATCC 49957 TaxID=525371 RepID=D5RQ36_9PROT|nr:sensor domain-containing phosphodiesterase [Pseudoroseomonas cervicalis]EFH10587.1 cyclic diguanylate phosphodiesterase (EAL) domain protein [Pseudoroseomonas cervicalis ATCC 49957]
MSVFMPPPVDERRRMEALLSLNLIDTPPSESYDRITRLAGRLLDAPVAAVSLTDANRQWFKSALGVDHREIPRHQAPCAVVSATRQMLVVPDLATDPRFIGSPLALAGVRFYAGAPLVTRDGHGLGAMCVLDMVPRQVSEAELQPLHDLAAMVMSQVELEHAFGRIDPVSGLPNRLQFIDEFAARGPARGEGAALVVDLSHSSQLGQAVASLGPAYVEALARHAAGVLRAALPRHGGLYQTGSSAFLALLEREGGAGWQAGLAALEAAFRVPVPFGEVPVTATPVFGIAEFGAAERDAEPLLRAAACAAEEARAAGEGARLYNAASEARSQRRLRLLTDMVPALQAEDQLSLVFQPRIDTADGSCLGAEALLRWHHPALGPVSPGEFIPLVEQTALTRPVTRWVIERAATQLAALRRDGIGLRISVNVSALNLAEPDFAEHLLDSLSRHGLAPQAVELEFTESALLRNGEATFAQLRALRALGMDVAIDDFGTGYSSLSYLQTLPANIVKLDQSFIRRLSSNARDQRLVAAMIQLAHDLGHRVVAEGVEDQAALDFLAARGCEEAQGYLIARPMPEAALRAWLAARGALDGSRPTGSAS